MAAAALLVVPGSALAHELVGKADLPIPLWLFIWSAAAVLAISFAALAIAMVAPAPRSGSLSPAPRTSLSRVITSRVTEVSVRRDRRRAARGNRGLARAARRAGERAKSLTPTFVYVAFWLGFVPVGVLFGGVFAAIQPVAGRWARNVGLADFPTWKSNCSRIRRGSACFPASLRLSAFVALELISARGD